VVLGLVESLLKEIGEVDRLKLEATGEALAANLVAALRPAIADHFRGPFPRDSAPPPEVVG
jgi:hypothetical protein